MLSLFRLIDINAGTIMLDGVDTASIALDSLRKQLAIIPQVMGPTVPIVEHNSTHCNDVVCSTTSVQYKLH